MERNALEALASLLGRLGIPVATAEDVMVLKLIAGRAQDVADVEAILVAKPTLDEGYIEQWAEFWGVAELWRRVRSG